MMVKLVNMDDTIVNLSNLTHCIGTCTVNLKDADFSNVKALRFTHISSGQCMNFDEMHGFVIIKEEKMPTYKTYTKDPTTGEVTLEMSNPSDILSPLGSASIIEDIAGMALQEDVDAAISDIASGIMGPRVDTFEQLPSSIIQESYTAPELRNGNGIPFVDEYAVSGSSVFSGLDAYMATYKTSHVNGVWHSENYSYGWFRMTFKNPFKANKLTIVNRSYSVNNIYAINYFDVRAKSGEEWVILYSGINQSGSGVETTFEFENDQFYQEYELTINSGYGGQSGNYVVSDLIQLSGISSIPNPDVQRNKVYFVGSADATHFDKYMVGPDGEWTEVNPASQQGVDFKDYSTTKFVTDTVTAKQIETNTVIATMKQEVTEDMSSLGTVVADSDKKDIKVVYTLPETWPSDLKDTATILLMKDVE